MHIRKYVNERPTATGIAIPENLMLRLLDTKPDFDRAYDEGIGLVHLLNDYIQLEAYPSGKVDMRYFTVKNGHRIYLKKGITLDRTIVQELFDVLSEEMGINV